MEGVTVGRKVQIVSRDAGQGRLIGLANGQGTLVQDRNIVILVNQVNMKRSSTGHRGFPCQGQSHRGRIGIEIGNREMCKFIRCSMSETACVLVKNDTTIKLQA